MKYVTTRQDEPEDTQQFIETNNELDEVAFKKVHQEVIAEHGQSKRRRCCQSPSTFTARFDDEPQLIPHGVLSEEAILLDQDEDDKDAPLTTSALWYTDEELESFKKTLLFDIKQCIQMHRFGCPLKKTPEEKAATSSTSSLCGICGMRRAFDKIQLISDEIAAKNMLLREPEQYDIRLLFSSTNVTPQPYWVELVGIERLVFKSMRDDSRRRRLGLRQSIYDLQNDDDDAATNSKATAATPTTTTTRSSRTATPNSNHHDEEHDEQEEQRYGQYFNALVLRRVCERINLAPRMFSQYLATASAADSFSSTQV
ncbi:hypothetical protein ACA910_003332 [Epithemia clementina (nom. ined.)]